MHGTSETLALIKGANAAPLSGGLAKSFTTATGLVFYDLEPAAKKLYPVITPLRNEIPRVGANGGTATNWKAITGVNVSALGAGVSEGRRGGTIVTATKDYLAAYKGYGYEDDVSYEADYAGEGFDDVKARAVEGLLRSVMIAEERMILGGNATLALGTANTPTVATATTGGAIAATTLVSVIVVALSHEGYNASRGSIASATAVRQQVTRTNADGTVEMYGGGSGMKSAAASVTTGGTGTNAVTASVARKAGEVAYAWFWGAAGAETLGAITTINSVAITTAAGAGAQAATSITGDFSTNALVFDGLLTQISTTGSNSYVANLPTGVAGLGTPLTSDGAGGIVEIDAALESFWTNFKLSPSKMLVNSQEAKNITRKIVANSGAPLVRFVSDVAGSATLSGGSKVGQYLNKFGAGRDSQMIEIEIHPDAIPGQIIFISSSIPYPTSNVANVLQMKMRRDFYQIEWPIRTRKYEYGVYADGVLQNYFPPAFGVLQNVGNG